MFFDLMKIYYESNRDGGNNSNGGNQNSEGESDNQQSDSVDFKSFDEFYNSLDDNGKKLVDPAKAHFERMQSTVTATREERDTLQTQLKDAIKQLKDGPDKDKFTEISNQLAEQQQRGDFLEEAPGHNCTNPKAAFIVAKAEGLFGKKGVDWNALQSLAPEFFGQQTQRKTVTRKTGAGTGTNEDQQPHANMNNWIRQQVGRGTITQ